MRLSREEREMLLALGQDEISVPLRLSLMDLNDAERERDALQAEKERDEEYLRRILSDVHEKNAGLAVCSWCALPTLATDDEKRAHQDSCKDNPMRAERDELRRRLAAVTESLEEARRWFDEKWPSLGDRPPSPPGSVLVLIGMIDAAYERVRARRS